MKPGKPLYGQPCNGCGLCCLAEQCPLSVQMFGQHRICPALQDDGDRWNCGLVSRPELFFDQLVAKDMGEVTAMLIGAGEECDAVEGAADAAERQRIGPATIRHKDQDELIDSKLANVRAKLLLLKGRK